MELIEALKKYLDQRAAEDPLFAESYKKPAKSLEECCRYINGEVYKKRHGSNCICLTDDEVYGMAVHYYDEDDIDINRVPKPQVATTKRDPEEEKKAVVEEIKREEEAWKKKNTQRTKPAEEKKQGHRQLTIFDVI